MTALSEKPAAAPPGSAGTVLRRFAGPVYVPATMYAIGQGAVLPILGVAAHNLGASYATAALIGGLPAVGVLVGDGPAGSFVARVGEKRGMLVSAALTLICCLAVVLAGSLVVLTIAALVSGAASSIFLLARHSLLTELVPPHFRARSLALLAGTYRAGITIGPFAAAALIARFGVLSAFWIQVVACLVVSAYLLIAPDPERELKPQHVIDQPSLGLVRMAREHASVLVMVGGPMAILMLLRNTMTVIVPLWGVAIDIPESQIAIAVGISGLLQLALVYTAGQLADRFGRMWVAMPVTVGIALGHLLLLTAHELVGYVAVVCLLSIANGFGGGIMMTIGSDLAPLGRAPEFLGLWRLVNDGGGAVAPFVLSGAAALVSLSFAAATLSGIGLVGAGLLWRFLPRYLERGRV
ncbi:MFS transporter [Nocardioides bruguierae]|uniref:MFS transporter n=1 Tax=Nocardioides bruguierae TaxID=2945102 RepID=A0A9X2IFA3_9ACTN|nr:MFS transporter [Nocardioides bruguierae]MCM0621127.1 MFS transporter [Nocardioides bruguierae]